MRAICSFMREFGISTVSCNALFALRMRASMSATGSVSISLPARLRHAGDRALVRELPQADPAETELAEDGARATAAVAAGVRLRLELGRALLLGDQRLLGHVSPTVPFSRLRT